MEKLANNDLFSGKSVIIADFDGTLVYLDTDWEALRIALRTYCLDSFHIDQSFERIDEGLFSIRQRFGNPAFYDLLEIVSSHEIQGYHGKKIESVLDILQGSAGTKKIAIFTSNCRNTIKSILPDLRLKIDLLVAKEDVENPKPSGEGIRIILKEFSCDPCEAIFLGDSANDMSAGNDAGVKTLFWRDAVA